VAMFIRHSPVTTYKKAYTLQYIQALLNTVTYITTYNMTTYSNIKLSNIKL